MQGNCMRFRCFFLSWTRDPKLGDWGYTGDDKPPWNVGPESTIAFSPACFFDVPEDFEMPENPEFRIQFITASGKRFSHRFAKQAPRYGAAAHSKSQAA
jgi:hypothetical protein